MNLFEVVVGLSSILSLIVAIFSLFKIEEIRNYTSSVSKNSTKQIIKNVRSSDSEIHQTGHNTNKDQG